MASQKICMLFVTKWEYLENSNEVSIKDNIIFSGQQDNLKINFTGRYWKWQKLLDSEIWNILVDL